jgi:rare lipoprotein A
MHATRSLLLIGLLAVGGCAVRAPAPTGICAESGLASWYHPSAGQRRTAEGHAAHGGGLTAAHPFLPFGTSVRVTDVETGRSVTVQVDDRGPFVGGRIIDVSAAAATRLGIRQNGIARVRLLATPGRSGPVPARAPNGTVARCTPALAAG